MDSSKSVQTERELVLTRVLKAPRDRVWAALTEPERITRWWGPEGYTAPAVHIDLRVGGKMHYAMRSPEGQVIWSVGTIQELDPGRRMLASDSFSNEQGDIVPASDYGFTKDFPLELTVEYRLEDHPSGTLLTLRHRGFPSEEDRRGAETGWSESFDKLEAFLR